MDYHGRLFGLSSGSIELWWSRLEFRLLENENPFSSRPIETSIKLYWIKSVHHWRALPFSFRHFHKYNLTLVQVGFADLSATFTYIMANARAFFFVLVSWSQPGAPLIAWKQNIAVLLERVRATSKCTSDSYRVSEAASGCFQKSKHGNSSPFGAG